MKKANRLVKEKSPYLLQHAYNPVDWFPWSEEAFSKAKDEDKAVFLSIGYSTCHWCHVMEKESFEDEEIAGLMNDAFISIKVDREERPDIDGIYMTACQMLTGSGGWPLTIIMTPEKKPFFAGTYFPRDSRFGRAGMKELVPQINALWKSKRAELLKASEEISWALRTSSSVNKEESLTEEIFKETFNQFEERYDEEFGGFGNAPKFPTPHNLMFLLRYWKRYKTDNALEMVEKTLVEMRYGGIYDQIGFGFSRYSTDSEWLVPHFEKMLYDQALLVMVYTEAHQVTGKNIYKETAEEILTYVMRDMASEEGGFFSAEDADSEGVEGKFYLWTTDEIRNILGKDADLFIKYFNIKEEGNFSETDEVKNNANILHIKKRIEDLAVEARLDVKDVKQKIGILREKIFKERKKRVHPYKDDKILTDWNGLMISAFSKAAQAFNNREYAAAAEKAADFILAKMFDESGRLLHRYRMGEAAIYANADDYAFIIAALLDLYETTFEIKYLKYALKLNEDFIQHFWDEETGGFFFTPDYGEKLISRQKEIYDGAVPSGNSVAMLNLLRIGRITAETKYEEMADRLNKVFSTQVGKYPSGYTRFLIALDFAVGPSKEIIISGNKPSEFKVEIFKKFLPNKILLSIKSDQDPIVQLVPYLNNYFSPDEKTKVFVCENYICNLPIEDNQGLHNIL